VGFAPLADTTARAFWKRSRRSVEVPTPLPTARIGADAYDRNCLPELAASGRSASGIY